ncbi:MAG: 30S ribosomal protein S1 [Thermodesulfobacteriota bacterium]
MEDMKEGAEGSFADMFAQTSDDSVELEPGQQVEAEVVRVDKDWLFIDLGGKSEGVIATSELVGDDGLVTVKAGERLSAYFLAPQQGQMLFTTRMSGAAAKAHLRQAFEAGVPLAGNVSREVKGGFEVMIAGNTRAFCPYSQMALRRVNDTSVFVDQEFDFQIIEYKEEGRNIIISRRTLLEEERAAQAEKLKETLQVGDLVSGTITSLRDFGAFVDVGGIEGLIPVSEISWGRVADIRATLEEGQQVEVAVLKLDWQAKRFSFSLKDTQPDPWLAVGDLLKEGECYLGRVERITDFGAFVNLKPGIDGLLHISALGAGRRINHPREVVADGEELEVRVDSVDADNHRISLTLPRVEKVRAEKAAKRQAEKKKDPDRRADYQDYKGSQQASKGAPGSMGTLGDLLKAKLDK